ncbi:hypothetical protein [Arthrobacter sp. W4I7]|uniref:hypothetical protein n=1 Tax=Arthrobacter sp. W4I7 TaxID=3042296 RepID=UPI0027D7D2BE|nr:hypothetical protein [Arthrobacter sp. W4I7]
MVRWRDPKTRASQGLTVASLTEAETLKRLLDANGQSFEIAQHAILSNEKRTPTVAEVIQEHIDLLIRPSSGTTKTYQTMLDLHVRNVIGHVPVDKLDYRLALGEVDDGEGQGPEDHPQRAWPDFGGHEYGGDAGLHYSEPLPRGSATGH